MKAKWIGVLLALCMIAAACGDDDDTGSSDDTPSTDSAESVDDSGADEEPAADSGADEEPAADSDADEEPADDSDADEEPADDGAVEVSGDPILVGFIGSDRIAGILPFDGHVEGFDAATLKIHSEGGINGRPIEVLTCADEGDPNIAAGCAEQLIDDGVVVFVGNFTPFGDAINPIIAEAGLSVIGGSLFSPGDFGQDFYYAIQGGTFAVGAGAPVACADAGAGNVLFALIDIPSAQTVPGLVENFVAAQRDELTLIGSEFIPAGTADYAPVAASVIAQNPECISTAMADVMIPPFIQALRAQGFDGPITVSGSFNTPEAMIEALGDDANNLIIVDVYDVTSDGWNEFIALAEEISGDSSPRIAASGGAFLSLNIAAEVLRVAGDNPAAVTAAIPEVVVDFDTGGLTAEPLDWSVPGDNPVGLSNLRNTENIARQIVDGEIVPLRGWVDVFGS